MTALYQVGYNGMIFEKTFEKNKKLKKTKFSKNLKN